MTIKKLVLKLTSCIRKDQEIAPVSPIKELWIASKL